MDALLPLAKCRGSRLRTSSGPGANIIFIEKRRSYPASYKNAYAFLISRSDQQCFSHEDGCFAAVSEVQGQPAAHKFGTRRKHHLHQKARTFTVKKVSALYIKTLRWYDLKLDARGIAVLSIVEDYG